MTSPPGSPPPLPLNWSQYNSDSNNASFAVTASPTNPALSGTKSISVTDLTGSGDISRAWLDQTMPADVQVSAAVYLNSSVPAQVIARGSNLDASGSGANFYAVQLSPGPTLTLVKDVNGTPTTLASVISTQWITGEWLEETLDVEGSTVRGQLFDPNTHEYLNSSGQWQSSQTWAMTVIDNSVTGPGVVGLGRPASYTGTATFDDFSVQAPAADQSFDATPVGSLPDNWSSYSSNGGDTIAVAVAPASPITPPSGPNALAITAVQSGDVARAWLTNDLSPDVSVSAYAYVEPTPSQVFARGSELYSTTPTYYAVEVSEGGVFQLVKVENGAQTVLGSVTSTSYFQDIWVQETLGLSGNNLYAQLYRPDTQQYMDSYGKWQSTPTWAFSMTDTSISGGGQEGVGRPTVQEYVDTNYFDDFTTAVGTDALDFDDLTSLPFGWHQWSSDQGYDSTYFAVAAAPDNTHFLSASNVLENTTGSVTSQLWNGSDYLTNAQVSVGMYLQNAGMQVIARATNLGSSTPSYYGLSVSPGEYGLSVALVRMYNGNSTTLAQISPLLTYVDNYFNDKWVQATLYVDGPSIRAQIYRADTGQYLNSEDEWQTDPTYALNFTDTDSEALTGPGFLGLVRSSGSGSSTDYFDNFAVAPLSVENTPPEVSIAVPNGTLTGTVTVTATPSSNFGISKVDFYVEDVADPSAPTILTHWEETAGASYNWDFDTTFVPPGTHMLVVQAYDEAGNIGEAKNSVTVSNNTTLTMPSFTPHQPNIGITELDYVQGDYETDGNSSLLQNVDVVVVDYTNLGDLAAIYNAYHYDQELIYTNVSNIYKGLLINWLNYAEQHAIDPEQAFYHVSVATPFTYSDAAGSTQPVDYFWGVYGYQNGSWSDLTYAAHSGTNNAVPFGNLSTGSVVGDTLNVGYTDEFREIDINLTQARSGGSYVLEYPTAVDSDGNPTAWATLTTISDTTNGLTTTGAGKIIFDPPSKWVPAVVDRDQTGSFPPPSNGFPPPRYYYVRFRTTAAFSTIPAANTVLGYNYTQAVDNNGTVTSTIPAFDYAADTNHDGYLDGQEYSHRSPGMDAYFAYQSRLFTYGSMRFVTNPSSPAFREWAINQYYP
ncbi:MAG TPA: Ig-like domain-containing protein, partial [Gemmataceae bacterium]